MNNEYKIELRVMTYYPPNDTVIETLQEVDFEAEDFEEADRISKQLSETGLAKFTPNNGSIIGKTFGNWSKSTSIHDTDGKITLSMRTIIARRKSTKYRYILDLMHKDRSELKL